MKILLVDDSAMVRAHLTTLLSNISGVEIVGHASTQDEAYDLIVLKHPDLVLMDISLECGNGLEVLQKMRGQGMVTRVLMLTNENASSFKSRSMDLGAQGYFDKSLELEKLIAQIEQWL